MLNIMFVKMEIKEALGLLEIKDAKVFVVEVNIFQMEMVRMEDTVNKVRTGRMVIGGKMLQM